MVSSTVSSESFTASASSPSLPMRGAILSALSSAFRLGDKLRDQTSGLSVSTTKRILQDEPAVRPEKRTAVARTLISNLFPIAYLRDRGLDEREAAVHDELIVAALDDILDRWEEVARWFNGLDRADLRFEFLLSMTGLGHEIVARSAAYLCLFPRLHPAIEAIGSWISTPGLRGVYAEMMGRIARPISLERQCRDTGLAKNAIKAIRDGETDAPQGETIERLALAFARYGVVKRHEDGIATAAEIEVELRVAAAVARARHELQAEQRWHWASFYIVWLRYMRSELRRFSREELAELLVKGSRSSVWQGVEPLIQRFAMSMVQDTARAIHADAQRRWSRFHEDPQGAMREAASELARESTSLRRSLAYYDFQAGNGSHVANLLDDMATAFGSIADAVEKKGGDEALVLKTDWNALESDGLVMKAMAPWSEHTPEEREALLREAVSKDPSSANARLFLSHVIEARGQGDEALAHRFALVGERPGDCDARYSLALSLSCAGRLEEALDELHAIDRLGGGSAGSHWLRGQCLLELDRPAEAEPWFQRALEENDRLVWALKGAAACRRAAGDERGAREYERRAVYYGDAPAKGSPIGG